MDDWGGETGRDSAALQPDNSGPTPNRIWQIIPAHDCYYRIRSTHETVLDNWGGITGYGSASLMPDDSGPSPNRIWKFIPVISPIMQHLVGKKIQFNFFLVAVAVAQSVKCPGLRSLTRGATELT